MKHALIFAAVAALLAAWATPGARAGEPVAGPINADVVSVYDGDTLTVDAHPWPGVTIRVAVRTDGFDAPEIRGRCEAEKAMAIEARELLRELAGEQVSLVNVRLGKYAGRVVASVFTARGRAIAPLMLESGLAREYHGEARKGWCDA